MVVIAVILNKKGIVDIKMLIESRVKNLTTNTSEHSNSENGYITGHHDDIIHNHIGLTLYSIHNFNVT